MALEAVRKIGMGPAECLLPWDEVIDAINFHQQERVGFREIFSTMTFKGNEFMEASQIVLNYRE